MKHKLKDGITKPFEKGDQVLFIPEHLLTGPKTKMVKHENLGIVTSKNDQFVFVKYLNNQNSQATRPEDLYFILNRLDLQEILNNNEEYSNEKS